MMLQYSYEEKEREREILFGHWDTLFGWVVVGITREIYDDNISKARTASQSAGKSNNNAALFWKANEMTSNNRILSWEWLNKCVLSFSLSLWEIVS